MVADIHSGDVATGGHGDQALTHADAAPSRIVLIYIRVSTEKRSQNLLSLNDQENQLVARAKRDGDNIIAIYRDEGARRPHSLRLRTILRIDHRDRHVAKTESSTRITSVFRRSSKAGTRKAMARLVPIGKSRVQRSKNSWSMRCLINCFSPSE
jgi:hypothetical protein